MEVRIGIQSVPREIVVETRATEQEVERALTTAVSDGGLFILPDGKGGKVLVPADKIGYIEVSGAEQRRIGFGAM